MKVSYLFDTHVWLWAQSEPEKLPKRVRNVIEDPDTTLFFSVASTWEIATKHALGRLELPESPAKYISSRLAENQVRILPIEQRHALRSAELPWLHNDPFDRLLIAQAQTERLIFISADRIARKYEISFLWK